MAVKRIENFQKIKDTDKKYLIICLRHNFWEDKDVLVFWGKNSNGYYTDLTRVQLYTKEEGLKISNSVGDCFIPVSYIGLTVEEFNNIKPHKALSIVVNKTPEICRYINNFVKLNNNKRLMKTGQI